MPSSVYIEVEENENCEYMPMLVYEARGELVAVGGHGSLSRTGPVAYMK